MATKFNAAFWQWFGDSQVVDAKGKPLVVYHGTGGDFSAFRPAHEILAETLNEMRISDKSPWMEVEGLKKAGEFYFFSEDESSASSYADGSGIVLRCYLRVERPPEELFRDNFSALDYLREHSKADGARYEDTTLGGGYGGPGWIVRKPNQIKAVDNDGTWDVNDPDIRSNPELDWIKKKEYETPYGDFEEYFLGGSTKNGILTIELDRRLGYRVRNIWVDEPLQGLGYATESYLKLNAESLKKTKKPLRSSEIGYGKKNSETSMSPDAVGLWEFFVAEGWAEKSGDHYVFRK